MKDTKLLFRKFFQSRLPDFLLIIILGLFPLFFWFKTNMLIVGGDIALPIGPERWFKEFYLWHSFRNLGQDMSTVIPSVVFFSIQAFLSWLKTDIILSQKIHFTFLFMLTGFSMYFFMNQVYKGLHQRLLYLIAVIFYMFNLYLEPIWSGFNVSNLSAYIAVPFFLGILLKIKEGKSSLVRLLFMTALASLVFAATAVNPPVLMAIVVVFTGCFIIYFIREVIRRNYSGIMANSRKIILFLLVILLINAFWLVPYVGEAFLYEALQSDPLKLDVKTWLAGMSAYSNIPNILRFQGHWAWYGGWNEPYLPYAHLYKDNIFFIILGWIIPALVLIGMIFSKFKYKYLFVGMTILSLVLSMGSHKPLGFIYVFLTKYLPYFWLVRSPWYKFTLVTCVGYAIFLGFAGKRIYEFLIRFNFKNNKIIAASSPILIVGIIMIYAFPVTLGEVFVPKEKRKVLIPNHTKVPEYIFEGERWLRDKKEFSRTIMLPSNAARIYDWDYVYPAPILSSFSTVPIIAPSYSNIFSPSGEELIKQFYRSLYSEFGTDSQELLRLMNTRYLLHETDIVYNYLGESIESPEFIKEKLSKQKNIKLSKSFGKWDFYEITNNLPHLYTLPKLDLVSGSLEILFYLTCINDIKADGLFFVGQQTAEINKTLLEINKFNSIILLDTEITDMVSAYVTKNNQFYLRPDIKKISFQINNCDSYIFWAHRNADIQADKKLIVAPTQPQKISLKIDNNEVKVKEIKTNLFNAHQDWLRLTEVYLDEGEHSLEFMEALGDVDKIFVISKSLYKALYSDLLNKLDGFPDDIHLIYSKRSVTIEPVYPNKESLKFNYASNFTKKAMGCDEYFWMSNNDNKLIIFNPDSKAVQLNLKFTIYSHGTPRNLFVELNGKDVGKHPEIIADVPVEIFLTDIELKPGENILNFLNYASTSRLDDISVSFGFMDFKTFKFEYKIKADILQEGNYEITLSPNMKSVCLDNKPLSPLKKQEFHLTKGIKEISFLEVINEDLFLNLKAKKKPSLSSGEAPVLKFEAISSTKYKVETENQEPFFLVFSESYHPGWRLYLNNKPLDEQQFLINAYANAWYIDEVGHNEFILEYFPQRLFNVGATATVTTFTGLFLFSIISLFWTKR